MTEEFAITFALRGRQQIITVEAETRAEAITLACKQIRQQHGAGWRYLRTTVGHLSWR
jgi:hypothetical protein